MLRENWRSIARIERLADSVIIILGFFIAYYGRSSLLYWDAELGWGLPLGGESLAAIGKYYIVLFVGLPLYIFTLQSFGAYDRVRITSHWRLLKVSLVSSCIVFLGIASILFSLKIDLSRIVIGLFCLIVTLSLTAERYLVQRLLRYWRGRARNLRNVIISGMGIQARKLKREILRRPELGLHLVGFLVFSEEDSELADDPKEEFRLTRGYRIFKGTSELETALKEHAVDEVIFTDIRNSINDVESAIILCAEEGIRTCLAADLFSIGMVKSEISYFGSMPLIHYHTPPGDRWELGVKRIIDLIGSGIMLLLVSPVMFLIAFGIRIMSPGPVIFKQKRVGLNGRLFWMYKFRSMKVDAERELQDLIDKNEMDGPVFKMKKDPRVTPFGGFLRRFSLDELPQLFNVLRGDMSLVGPRPPVPQEVDQYERKQRRRLSMRPGLTCIWQVSGRNEIKDFKSWMEMDLRYIDNWSLMLDFRILCKTVPAVLFGYGAR